MAPKRPKEDPLEHPPPASDHSSSDEEASEDEEEESSSEGTPPPKPAAAAASQKPQSSTSADSGSGSDSDSDTETTPLASDHVVKPVASKPIEKSPVKSPRSKPASTPAATKRPAEAEPEKKESKRTKKRTKSDGTAEKTRPRVWSEDDGIAVLKGMIEFQEKNGSSPSSDMNGFHDFIKNSLRADVSKTQLSDKIRHLKTKYMANLEKMKKDESGSSLKPHEKELFDLSKKIWGESNGIHTVKAVDQQPKSSTKKLKSHGSAVLTPHKPEAPSSVEIELKSKGLVQNLVAKGVGNIEDFVLKKGLDLIEGSKRAELEERWALLHKAELELFVKRTELIYEQARLVLEARK